MTRETVEQAFNEALLLAAARTRVAASEIEELIKISSGCNANLLRSLAVRATTALLVADILTFMSNSDHKENHALDVILTHHTKAPETP